MLELLLEFACKSFSYFSMLNHCQGNIKNILILEILKNKTTFALFKKKSRKVNQKLINAGVRWLHNRKDVKKNIKKEQGKSFLELICFIFDLSFKRACLKNGQHLTQKFFMLSPFKNWCFWFPYILNFQKKKQRNKKKVDFWSVLAVFASPSMLI